MRCAAPSRKGWLQPRASEGELMISRRRFFQTAPAAVAISSALRGAEVDPALVKAMEELRAAIPTAESDPDRPIYHFHPPANWNNDPNGTLFYKSWPYPVYRLNPTEALLREPTSGHT